MRPTKPKLREVSIALTLARLRTLRSVAECRSFAEAARELGVSQPAVSQHVRELESAYGVRLFLRRNGALAPTPLCEELTEIAERMMLDREAAERLLTRHSSFEHGRLSIGLGNTMPGMAVIAAFHRSHPSVRLTVENGSHEQITRAVLGRTVDVGILPDVPEDGRFRRVDLVGNEVVAIAPPGYGLTGRTAIGCADLAEHPLIFRSRGSSTQRVVDRAFRRAGLRPRPFLTLDTRDGVYEAVANGLGIGFMWRHCTGRVDGVDRLRLDGGGNHSEVAFALASETSQLLNSFFGSLRELDIGASLAPD